jgi:hypothetical protein
MTMGWTVCRTPVQAIVTDVMSSLRKLILLLECFDNYQAILSYYIHTWRKEIPIMLALDSRYSEFWLAELLTFKKASLSDRLYF